MEASARRIAIAVALAFACCSCAGRNDAGSVASPGASRAAQTKQKVVVLSALHRGRWPNSILFAGHWQLVRNRADGRYEGSSERSFHFGDTMTVIFAGRRFCIYGVLGENGGTGQILISGRAPQTVEFRAPSKEAHRLVFDSGVLPGSVQTASLSVIAPDDGRPRGYVNVEEVEIR